MNGQRIGYIRVSSEDQNPERQLNDINLDKIFIDRLSGRNCDRPQLEAMLSFIREGDIVIVHSMDRLARNLDDLRKLVRVMTDKKVKVEFIKEHLTFTGDDAPMSNLLLSVMGAFAEFERELIRERQREGIAIAKAKGVFQGRKRALTPEQEKELGRRIKKEAKSALAREYGVSVKTIYNYLERK